MTTEPNKIPAADRFTNENGLDWFWKGNHTLEQALSEFCNDDDNLPDISSVRGNIVIRSGDVSDSDEFLELDPIGEFEFWQVEGGEY